MVCYLTTHLQSVEFVLGAGGPVVAGCAHGLLSDDPPAVGRVCSRSRRASCGGACPWSVI